MPACPQISSEDELSENIVRAAKHRPLIIGIAGLPGAGKTTLAKKMTSRFLPAAMQVSEDDFCVIPTSQRKEYLTHALAADHLDKLRSLAAPLVFADNPYADPLSWYDWKALKECLVCLQGGQAFSRTGCWDQETGECTKSMRYCPPQTPNFLCFVDTNYPLEYRELIDLLILIEVDPSVAIERQALRDAHRSDKSYLAYKKMIDELYVQPYCAKTKKAADFIFLEANHAVPTNERLG